MLAMPEKHWFDHHGQVLGGPQALSGLGKWFGFPLPNGSGKLQAHVTEGITITA